MKEELINGKGFKYLGEVMNDLPDNVMLNKVITGCGMTSVALNNEKKYVIVVPFVSLILNKQLHCKNNGIELCTVFGAGATHDDIIAFQGNKIMTTYDSIDKVVKALEQRGDIKDWKVLVDEAHKLVDSAAFRGRAVQKVLDNYEKFESFVFGTATPVKDEYQIPDLKNINKVKIDWGSLQEVKVNFCHYDGKLNMVMAVLAIEFLQGVRDGNAHIFINSVQSITSIIRYMKRGGFDRDQDIRIVCADNNGNFQSINSRLGQNYTIESINSEVKKINFYTATAFEGCDIFDKDGKVFIATDGSKDYTKIDIMTVLPQIIGRIRDSEHNGSIELLYTKNDYISTETEQEFKAKVKAELKKAAVTVNDYNNVADNTKEIIIQGSLSDSYLIVENDQLKVNEANWYNEMHNFSTLRQTYYVSRDGNESGIEEGKYTFNGTQYKYSKNPRIEIKGLNKIRIGATPSFEDICKEYVELMDKGRSLSCQPIREKEPIIQKAYNILGPEKMKALRYRRKAIEKEFHSRSINTSKDQKIVSMLDLKAGKWYSRSELKESLQNIYDQLQINSKAKASDMKKWFELKACTRRINGEVINGFEITFCKIKKVVLI